MGALDRLGFQVVPAKGMVTIAMVLKMMKALHRLSDRGPMPLTHPPHDKAQALIRIIPLAFTVIELFVNGIPHELRKTIYVLPD